MCAMFEAVASTYVDCLQRALPAGPLVETAPPCKVDGRGKTGILFRFRYIFTLILIYL